MLLSGEWSVGKQLFGTRLFICSSTSGYWDKLAARLCGGTIPIYVNTFMAPVTKPWQLTGRLLATHGNRPSRLEGLCSVSANVFKKDFYPLFKSGKNVHNSCSIILVLFPYTKVEKIQISVQL